MTEDHDDSPLLTVSDVAERLKLNPETIRRMLRDGRLRGVHLGSDSAGWRVSESALHAFIAERTRPETVR